MKLSEKVGAACRSSSSPTERRNDDGTFTVDGPSYIALLELRNLGPEVQTALQQAERGESFIRSAMRHATEEEVDAALQGSYVAEEFAGSDRPALLEFWNRMLDRYFGPRGEDD